jgi:hypothetical protein
MSKKMMLLALAAVSAALFAMPAVASANWGVDPINQEFTGTSDVIEGKSFVGNLSAEGEPKITCEGPSHVTGKWTDGTKGSFSLHATNCHASVIFTIPCKTKEAPLNNTILTSGTFKNVTLKPTIDPISKVETGKRGITVTPAPTTVECLSISSVKVSGTIIGRITEDPSVSSCSSIDSTVTLEFLIKEGKQDPMKTEPPGSASEADDLTAQTGSEAAKTAALEDKIHLSTVSNTTWTCNAP